MAFMINEGFIDMFRGPTEAAMDMVQALYEEDERNKLIRQQLDTFVRRGGDELFGRGDTSKQDWGVANYQEFVTRHPLWKDTNTDSVSVFSLHPEVKPLLRHSRQDSLSVEGCPVAAAVNLYYCQYCREGGQEEGHNKASPTQQIETFALNVCRFMHAELSTEEKFNYIFHSRGFNAIKIMTRAMKPCNRNVPTNELICSLYLFASSKVLNDRDKIFQEIQTVLRFGPLFTGLFRLFPDYGTDGHDTHTLNSECTKMFEGGLHTINIIGAARTRTPSGEELHGGILFAIQDSDLGAPFKQIGLDLLLKMGIKTLQYLNHREELSFPRGGVVDLSPDFVCTIRGSISPQIVKVPPKVSAPEMARRREVLRHIYEKVYIPSWEK